MQYGKCQGFFPQPNGLISRLFMMGHKGCGALTQAANLRAQVGKRKRFGGLLGGHNAQPHQFKMLVKGVWRRDRDNPPKP
jgi:hypothetical protein